MVTNQTLLLLCKVYISDLLQSMVTNLTLLLLCIYSLLGSYIPFSQILQSTTQVCRAPYSWEFKPLLKVSGREGLETRIFLFVFELISLDLQLAPKAE